MMKADISKDRKKAYHYFGLANVADAGNYTCKINTTTPGVAVNGNHQVFGLYSFSTLIIKHLVTICIICIVYI